MTSRFTASLVLSAPQRVNLSSSDLEFMHDGFQNEWQWRCKSVSKHLTHSVAGALLGMVDLDLLLLLMNPTIRIEESCKYLMSMSISRPSSTSRLFVHQACSRGRCPVEYA
jgi:hypothetical protein